MRHSAILCFAACLCLTGCDGWVAYFEPTSEELIPEKAEEGILPQEGTTLHLKLDYDIATKFEPAYKWKMYRYRVLIDGELYSYGVNDRYYTETLDIPLIANDSYTVHTITAEGSKSVDFSGEEKWDDWHPLYTATQACLAEGQPRRYASLENARLILTIEGKKLAFSLDKNGSAEALKRYLSRGGITSEVQVNYMGIAFQYSTQRELLDALRAQIPANYGAKSGILPAGTFSIFNSYGFFANSDDQEYDGYTSAIGKICPESVEDLQALKRMADAKPAGLFETTVTLSIE